MKLMMITLFITVALSVYLFLNGYLYQNIKFIFKTSAKIKMIFHLLFLFLLSTPIIATILNKKNIESGSYLFSYIGFSWLAFIFIFFAYHVIYSLFAHFTPLPQNRTVLNVFLSLSMIILLYGAYEAKQIEITTIHLKSEKLPKTIKQLCILQFSDIHFGPALGQSMAQHILDITRKLKPDLIVFTGDMLDKNVYQREEVIQTMRKLRAPYGKYSCLGNHEYISGIKDAQKFIGDMDITILKDTMINISNILYLAGSNDLSAPRFGSPIKDEASYLKLKNKNLFTIFLKHQPRVNKESIPYFDLQLSGHTHKGQIFPFYFLVKIAFPYISGLYAIDNKTNLYVNRGTGFWGPPIRFIAPSEATLIVLEHQ